MLFPLNRYLVVEPLEEEKTTSGVIIPEDVNIETSAFKLVKILMPHLDSGLRENMKVLVPTHMIEEAVFFGETYYLVLENHVVGYLGD
jgi:co-chaperonin GroES (HSP10)